MAREDTHLTQTGAEVQALLDKVEGIEEGAQVNKIDSIVVDGQALTPSAEGVLDMSSAMGYGVYVIERTSTSPAYYEVVEGNFADAATAFFNKRPVYLYRSFVNSDDFKIAVAQRAVEAGGEISHIYFVEQDGDTVLLYDFDGSVPTRIELPDYMPIPDDAWELTAQGGVRTKGAGNAAGEYGTAEGLYTSAANAAHSEGMGTIAGNAFSHAEGRYNHSEAVTSVFGHRGNTHHSIGIGTNDVDRKNAIEVKQNGDVYMIGVGGYNGKNWDNAQTVQTSLEAAYQKPQYGIPESDLDYSVTDKLREKVHFNSLPSPDITSVEDLEHYVFSRNDLISLADGTASALIFNELTEYGASLSDYRQTECTITKCTKKIGDVSDQCELSFILNGYEYAITADYNTGVATVTVTAVEDVADKADKVSNATSGHFAALDANGNLTDSGKSASDFGTYSKPANGIPASDLADGVIPDISGKADAATTLAGYGITDAYTKTEVDSKVASTYKPAGSVADVAGLGSLTAANLGKVYNFTASFTTTSDFVEGSGKTYPVGTNVVIVDVGTAQNPSYKYDVLAGFVDLSGYYQLPSGGIPSTDLASAVQTSLGKADTALQSFTETDPTVPSWAKQPNKPSYSYSEISNTPTIPDELADLADDSTHRVVTDAEKTAWSAKYDKPSGGIPTTDLVANKALLETTTVPNVTSAGSASTWSFSVDSNNHKLTISGGNGTAPTLGTAKTVATGNIVGSVQTKAYMLYDGVTGGSND